MLPTSPVSWRGQSALRSLPAGSAGGVASLPPLFFARSAPLTSLRVCAKSPIQCPCGVCVEHTVLLEPSSPDRCRLQCNHHVLHKDGHSHPVSLRQVIKAVRRNAVVAPIQTSQRVATCPRCIQVDLETAALCVIQGGSCFGTIALPESCGF